MHCLPNKNQRDTEYTCWSCFHFSLFSIHLVVWDCKFRGYSHFMAESRESKAVRVHKLPEDTDPTKLILILPAINLKIPFLVLWICFHSYNKNSLTCIPCYFAWILHLKSELKDEFWMKNIFSTVCYGAWLNEELFAVFLKKKRNEEPLYSLWVRIFGGRNQNLHIYKILRFFIKLAEVWESLP